MQYQKGLDGAVEQPLVLTDEGVGQYMHVNTATLGDVMILPSPSYSGIIAQVNSRIGSGVNIDIVGYSRDDIPFGVLLNQALEQHGSAMDYLDLAKEPKDRTHQVLYVGEGRFFPRETVKSKKQKRFMTVRMPIASIPVRFDHVLRDARTLADVLDFQGFVICQTNGSDPSYRLWFELTRESFLAAANDDNYAGLRDHLPARFYRFRDTEERLDERLLTSG